MATTRLIDIKVTDKRAVADIIKRSLMYDWNFKKTRNGELITCINCEKESAVTEFLLCQKEYEMTTGKAVDLNANSNVLYKIRQSFAIGEVDFDTAHKIGIRLAESFLKGGYQCTISTHVDKAHTHNHITFNAVGTNLKKYNMKKYDWKILREKSDKLCAEYGLSVVTPSKEPRSQVYSKCKSGSFRNELKADIDEAVKNAENYDGFLKLMSENYFIDASHKHITFRHKLNGQQRNIRLESLGEEYSSDKLKNSFKEQKKSFEKIKLSFEQTVKAKGKKYLVDYEYTSYSQKLRNIQVMLSTVGVINEFNILKASEIDIAISNASSLLNDNEDKLQIAKKEFSRLSSILKSMTIFEQYKSVVSEHSRSLLPEHFYSAHRDELEMYSLARQHLESCHIDLSAVNISDIENQVSTFGNTINSLSEADSKLKKQLLKIKTAKGVVNELHQRKVINNKKMKLKEGKKYVR